MTNDGALPEGLRLGNGSLIIKAGKDRTAVQIRVTADGPPMARGVKARKRGLSREQVPILVAADRTGATLSHTCLPSTPTA